MAAVPLAGLAAWLLERRGGAWPKLPTAALVAAVVVCVAALVLASFVFVPVLLAGGTCVLLASRLAEHRRGWIVAWLVGSAACFVVDVLGLWLLWQLRP